MLEPAGSKGCWGLDDYQHLAFVFGANQLRNHEEYTPGHIFEEEALNEEADYLYFSCVRFVSKVKSGANFGVYSPILNDISGV